MDFEDIIYVLLAIVFSAAGALGKRKKRTVPQTKSSKVQDIFNQLFDEEQLQDPIQQVANYTDSEDTYTAMEDENLATIEPEYESFIKEESIQVEEFVDNKNPKPSVDSSKPHRILVNLRDKDELKKAFIYAEVLKPKFKSL